MRHKVLTRFRVDPHCCLGRFIWDDYYSFFTVERGWFENAPYISCIPLGTYRVEKLPSTKFLSPMWRILDVPDRFGILFHVANFPTDVMGCIGLGEGVFENLAGVTHSNSAMDTFNSIAGTEPFLLTIEEGLLCLDS